MRSEELALKLNCTDKERVLEEEREFESFIRKSLPESIDKETCKLHHLKQEEWDSKNIEFLVPNIKQLITDVIKYINTDSLRYPLYIKEPEKITYKDFKIFLRNSNNSHLIPKRYTYELHSCGREWKWYNKLLSSFLGVKHDTIYGIRTPLEIKKAKESPYGGRKSSFLDVRIGSKFSMHTGSYMATVLNYLFIIRLEWQPIDSVQWIIDKENERLQRDQETRYSGP